MGNPTKLVAVLIIGSALCQLLQYPEPLNEHSAALRIEDLPFKDNPDLAFPHVRWKVSL